MLGADVSIAGVGLASGGGSGLGVFVVGAFAVGAFAIGVAAGAGSGAGSGPGAAVPLADWTATRAATAMKVAPARMGIWTREAARARAGLDDRPRHCGGPCPISLITSSPDVLLRPWTLLPVVLLVKPFPTEWVSRRSSADRRLTCRSFSWSSASPTRPASSTGPGSPSARAPIGSAGAAEVQLRGRTRTGGSCSAGR